MRLIDFGFPEDNEFYIQRIILWERVNFLFRNIIDSLGGFDRFVGLKFLEQNPLFCRRS